MYAKFIRTVPLPGTSLTAVEQTGWCPGEARSCPCEKRLTCQWWPEVWVACSVTFTESWTRTCSCLPWAPGCISETVPSPPLPRAVLVFSKKEHDWLLNASQFNLSVRWKLGKLFSHDIILEQTKNYMEYVLWPKHKSIRCFIFIEMFQVKYFLPLKHSIVYQMMAFRNH